MSEGIARFEDLIAWQKARELVRGVYLATREGAFARDFAIASQMQRSAVSIMANIAEGFERNRPTEFHQFLSMAKASCAEVRSHLYVALDAGYLTPGLFESLMALAIETSRVIGGLRASVERNRDTAPGRQFAEPEAVYSAFGSDHSALSTQHSALGSALSTQHSALR